MAYPVFNSGDVLNASDMNAVGLWKITSGITASTTGAGASATVSDGTISITGNATALTVSSAFSSTYMNYVIVITQLDSSVVDNALRMTFNNVSTSVYNFGSAYNTFASTTAAGLGGVNQANALVGFLGDTDDSAITITVFSPQASKRTQFTFDNVSSNYWVKGGGIVKSTNQNTGFTLTPDAPGTITGGEIRVYGYRN